MATTVMHLTFQYFLDRIDLAVDALKDIKIINNVDTVSWKDKARILYAPEVIQAYKSYGIGKEFFEQHEHNLEVAKEELAFRDMCLGLQFELERVINVRLPIQRALRERKSFS